VPTPRRGDNERVRIWIFLAFLALSVVLTLVTGQLFFFLVLPFAFVWPRKKRTPEAPSGADPAA
jgi:hypothetical protein